MKRLVLCSAFAVLCSVEAKAEPFTLDPIKDFIAEGNAFLAKNGWQPKPPPPPPEYKAYPRYRQSQEEQIQDLADQVSELNDKIRKLTEK